MNKAITVAAFAIILSITIVTMSFAGASCCDPSKAAGVPQPVGIQGAGPAQVGAAKPATPALPNNPGWQGMAAFMGYGKPEGARLSDLAPRGSCCTNPNASCAARANAAGQQPMQGSAPACSGGCCGAKNSGAQPAQAIGQFNAKPIQAVAPIPQPIAPISELGSTLTASPVKALAKPKPSGSWNLW